MTKLVYTAMSRHSAYAKEFVCAHAFLQGAVPLNPFSMFGYFLFDLVDRNLVRAANARVISAVDEVWSYGPIADGCLAEILQARNEGKPVLFFSVAPTVDRIRSLSAEELTFETPEIQAAFIERFK